MQEVIEIDGTRVTLGGKLIGYVTKNGLRWYYKPRGCRTWRGPHQRQRECIDRLKQVEQARRAK